MYLNDNYSFIETPKGKNNYLCTIKYENCEYGVKEFPELGIIFCDDKPDTTFRFKITVTTEDHNINYVMLKKNDFFISNLRFLFERGAFRFKNLKCKDAILHTLSY